MADKKAQLVLEALIRAAGAPEGIPLLGGKASAGLFLATGPGREAAQQCKDDGLLRVVRTEARGKTVHEICAITEKGLAYLLREASPKQVLADLARVLEARHGEVEDLVRTARQIQHDLETLKALVEKVLLQVQQTPPSPPTVALPVSANGAETWPITVVEHLACRQAAGTMEDCPLPELYRRARQSAASLSIGEFHDGLRQLLEREQIYLHPWTGPLYEIPEPTLVLLVGHEIAYYASIRRK